MRKQPRTRLLDTTIRILAQINQRLKDGVQRTTIQLHGQLRRRFEALFGQDKRHARPAFFDHPRNGSSQQYAVRSIRHRAFLGIRGSVDVRRHRLPAHHDLGRRAYGHRQVHAETRLPPRLQLDRRLRFSGQFESSHLQFHLYVKLLVMARIHERRQLELIPFLEKPRCLQTNHQRLLRPNSGLRLEQVFMPERNQQGRSFPARQRIGELDGQRQRGISRKTRRWNPSRFRRKITSQLNLNRRSSAARLLLLRQCRLIACGLPPAHRICSELDTGSDKRHGCCCNRRRRSQRTRRLRRWSGHHHHRRPHRHRSGRGLTS